MGVYGNQRGLVWASEGPRRGLALLAGAPALRSELPFADVFVRTAGPAPGQGDPRVPGFSLQGNDSDYKGSSVSLSTRTRRLRCGQGDRPLVQGALRG